MAALKLHLLYRDARNYKTYLDVTVDPSVFRGADKLKVEDSIEMGTFGSPSQSDFFDSEIHPYHYNHSTDHNLLEVCEIEEVAHE
jgi:hypothetical protein